MGLTEPSPWACKRSPPVTELARTNASSIIGWLSQGSKIVRNMRSRASKSGSPGARVARDLYACSSIQRSTVARMSSLATENACRWSPETLWQSVRRLAAATCRTRPTRAAVRPPRVSPQDLCAETPFSVPGWPLITSPLLLRAGHQVGCLARGDVRSRKDQSSPRTVYRTSSSAGRPVSTTATSVVHRDSGHRCRQGRPERRTWRRP